MYLLYEYIYKIFYTRHWEGELEGLRTTQQRVTAQHLGHQWYNEDLLKQRPVTSPLIPSKFYPFTQLPLPIMSVLIPSKLLSSTIKCDVYLYMFYVPLHMTAFFMQQPEQMVSIYNITVNT